MPLFSALIVWVVTPTCVPLAAVDPVMVTEIPVAEPWFALNPPLVTVVEVVPTAMIPDGLAMLSEKVPVFGLLSVSPVYEAVMVAVRFEVAASAYVTAHAPAERAHRVVVKVPVELLDEKSTSPDGERPVTFALHVVNLPTSIEEGEQETDTDVEALTAVTVTPTVVGVVVAPRG